MNRFKITLHLVLALGVSPVLAGAYEDFFSALIRDDAGAIGSLLQRGFDPDSRDAKGQPALTLAIQRESTQVAKALAANPATNVNALNEAGESPLMLAALKGDMALCEQLLARGARIDQPGWAPLHYAATGPDARIVRLLLERGAALEAESPNHSTPLMMAAGYGNEESVDLLLARGADPKRRNERNLQAADFARRAGRERLAERLTTLAR